MYTPSTIKKIMEENGTPYFLLSSKDHKHAPERTIYSNRGQDNVDLKNGMDMFSKQLEIHGENPNQVFVIELYRAKTGGHGAGKLGPFEFQLDGAQPQNQNQPQNGGNSLNGMPGMGSLSGQYNEAINGLGQLYASRDQLIREQGKLDLDRALFEQEKKKFEEEKKEHKRETEELRKKFESNSERVKAGAEKALMGMLDQYLGKGASSNQPLAGVEEQEEPMPEEMQKLNDFLNELVDQAESEAWTLQEVIEFENKVREQLIHLKQNANGIHED